MDMFFIHKGMFGGFSMLRKFSVLAILILFCTQAEAMKRAGGLLVQEQSKRFKSETEICLYEALSNHNFDGFEKAVSAGADINKKFNEEHLFFNILNKVDTLRQNSLSMLTTPGVFQKDAVNKNNGIIASLYKSLRLITRHPAFDIKCTDINNNSVLQFLICRNEDGIYSDNAEETLKSHDEQFILIDLLHAGVSASEDDGGFTPLHYVVCQHQNSDSCFLNTERNLKMAETLIRYGADVNALESDGDTPLHWCSDDIRMTLLLLAYGARFDVKNNFEETPAGLSDNPLVRDGMLANAEVVEKCRNSITKILSSHIASDANQSNIVHFMTKRQVGQASLQPVRNVSPITRAVIEYTKDINLEDMMREMGYLQGEHSVSGSIDEDESYED
jgi:ankyrin repeat protein